MKNGTFLITLLVVAGVIFFFIFWDGVGSRSFDSGFRESQSRVGTIAEPALNREQSSTLSANQVATNDAKRRTSIQTIERGLALYYSQRDEYPVSLQVLLDDKKIRISDIDGGGIRRSDFFYQPYAQVSFTGVPEGKCGTGSGTTCKAYHLGVNMQDIANVESGRVHQDRDAVSWAIDGYDGDGCRNEADRACYDVVGPR